MAPKPWFHKGLRFACTQCGNCCRNHGDYTFVYLAAKDIAALSRHLKLAPREFLARYCARDEGRVTLRMDAPACPFLRDDNTCAVYAARPMQCRTWPFWIENLERDAWEGAVKECCPGIGKGELVSAEEIQRIAAETEAWYEE